MANPIIKVENLSKSFGTKVILHNINLEVNRGEIFGLMGANGSGKSTLLNTIVGYLDPEEGKVLLEAEASKDKIVYYQVQKRKSVVKKFFGFAAQEPSFYKKLTVGENLDYFSALYGLRRNIRHTNADTIIDLMELKDHKRKLAEDLSGGMQRRLDFACALVHEPKVLILDEPTAELDPLLRKEIWGLVHKIKQKGTTIIIASHYLEEIENMCDRVAVMSNGRVEAIGTPTNIKSKYGVNSLTKVMEKVEKRHPSEDF